MYFEKKRVIAMLLAGGQGSRLHVLTRKTAKPAVPFGGKYRIIDFPLSNCVNSGIDTVGILTQYQPLELNEYIGNGQPWGLNKTHSCAQVLPPYERNDKKSGWFEGTANAIYKNIDFVDRFDPDYVVILSGDHIIGIKAIHKVDVLIDGVCSTFEPAGLLVVALVGRQNLGAGLGLVQAPGLAVADVLVQLQRLILGQNTDGVDAGIDTVGQGEVNDTVLAAEGNRRLGGLPGQDMQAAALATGQQHCDYAFFLKIHGHSSLYKLMDAKGGALRPEKGRKGAHFSTFITYHISFK